MSKSQAAMREDEEWRTPDWVRVGTVFRVFYGKNHSGNRKYHIRAIVDGDQVVFRHWNAGRGWIYAVERSYLFTVYEQSKAFVLVTVGQGEGPT